MSHPPEPPLAPKPPLAAEPALPPAPPNYGEPPPLGCAFTPLRVLGLAFVGLPIWNGVLWALVGDLGIGLDGGAALQIFELISVSSYLLAVFAVRAWVRRPRRDADTTSAD